MNHEPYKFGGVMIEPSQEYKFDDEFYIKAEQEALAEADRLIKKFPKTKDQSIVI